MAKPQQRQCDNGQDASSTNDYAPKEYSLREQAWMGLKIFLIIGALFGFLWLVNAAKA